MGDSSIRGLKPLKEDKRLSDSQELPDIVDEGRASGKRSFLTRENLEKLSRQVSDTPDKEGPNTKKRDKEKKKNVSRAPSEESVVTPPYFPTSRHHSFFLDGDSDEDSDGPDESHFLSSKKRHSKHHDTSHGADVGQADSGKGADSSVAVRSGGSETEDLDPMKLSIGVPPPFLESRTLQWNLLTFGRCKDMPLYDFEEICWWQKYNPYIRSGYRSYYDVVQTFKSFLGWHNETLNIWTHFGGFLFFVAFTIYAFCTLFTHTITLGDLHYAKLLYFTFCCGSMICMLNSTVYHLFTGHCNHHVVTGMGRLDFLGITILIVTSFLPPLYTLFSCYRTLRNVYIFLIILLGLAGIFGPWTRIFHTSTALRTSIYVGIVASGIIPAIHLMLILPLNGVVLQILIGILLMMLFYGIGVIFYVTRFPERKYPGKFDYFLSSHQLWHFFVFVASVVHYFNLLAIYQLWLVSDGAC